MDIRSIISDSSIEQVIGSVLSEFPDPTSSRTWIMEYLYKYEHFSGNCLPRGKAFDKVRDIESNTQWHSYIQESQHQIIINNLFSQISPYLLSQLALYRAVTIEGICLLNTDSFFDELRKIEQGNSKKTLIKHNIKFNKKGKLAGYKHHHIPLTLNSYTQMLSKNVPAMRQHIDPTLRVDFKKVESDIANRKASGGGKMTGHWLISKKISEINYYLGIFPHGLSRGIDDDWILKMLIESEKWINVGD